MAAARTVEPCDQVALRGAGDKTCTSASGNPAAFNRAAIASAAFSVSPVAVTVLISTSSLWMSRASCCCGVRVCAQIEMAH
jgi:hypothetical protein